jgi:hypothetical protein
MLLNFSELHPTKELIANTTKEADVTNINVLITLTTSQSW